MSEPAHSICAACQKPSQYVPTDPRLYCDPCIREMREAARASGTKDYEAQKRANQKRQPK